MKISYHYLVDPIETRQALAAFVGQPVIGLDTETFRDSSTGRNQLSLLQLAALSGEILVIDGLAAGITEAGPVIEDAGVPMVAHNARFDDGSLKEAGFKPAGLIDTRGASSFQAELDVSLGTGATQVQVIQEQFVPARVATAA